MIHPYVSERFPGFCQNVMATIGRPRLSDNFQFSKVCAYADRLPAMYLDELGFQCLPLTPDDHVWCWELFLDDELVWAMSLGEVYIDRIPRIYKSSASSSM
jgi:hypothetical protein